ARASSSDVRSNCQSLPRRNLGLQRRRRSKWKKHHGVDDARRRPGIETSPSLRRAGRQQGASRARGIDQCALSRRLISLYNRTRMSGDGKEIRFQGQGVSPGLAHGIIHVVRDGLDDIARYHIEPAQIGNEIARFEAALVQTRVQILEMQQKIAEAIGAKDAAIFDAHLLVVEDRTLIDEVLRRLESERCNVEWVFQEVASNYAETLSKIDDPYLRERAVDMQDVTKRIVRNLQGKGPKLMFAAAEPHLLVAHNLPPSDTATMNRQLVLGIATDLGSGTSHTAIIARSLNIPAVVGLHDATEKL